MRDPKSETTALGGGLLEEVLQAERDAERKLAEARARADGIVEAARADAQDVERRTDRRIDAARKAFVAATKELADEVSREGGDEESQPGVGPDARRHAAREIALRLLGLSR